MNNLEFIQDIALRKNIEDAIEYLYLLFDESQKRTSGNELFQEESYRVVILYVVAIIEAILLYLYKTHGEELTITEYKYIQTLPVEYTHSAETQSRVVVAVPKKMKRPEHQVGLFELIGFFKSKKLIQEKTADSILNLNNIRNTLHLSKPRAEVRCDLNQVESAFKLLVHTIEKAPKSLIKK